MKRTKSTKSMKSMKSEKEMKFMIFFIVLLALSTLSSMSAADENETLPERDLNISVYLREPLYTFVEYSQLFKIVNLNYTQENRIDIDLSVHYTVTDNMTEEQLVDEIFFLTGLRQYKYANTGLVIFNAAGSYTICGSIINSTVNDTNPDNDHVCGMRTVQDTSAIACNVTINVSTDRFLYEEGETIIIENFISNESFFYSIEYWVEDLFGNVLKNPINTSNLNDKRFTPSIAETDRVLIVRNRIAELACNNTNASTVTASESMVIMKKQNEEEGNAAQESNVSIISVSYEDEDRGMARFGEQLQVHLQLYKGDTRRRVLYAWTEQHNSRKSSERTRIEMKDKFTHLDVVIPVWLKADCSHRLREGTHELVVDGLGLVARADVQIEGYASVCGNGSPAEAERNVTAMPEAQFLDLPPAVDANKSFNITVGIYNREDAQLRYELYSYVYRGAKSYSGQRDANLHDIDVPAGKIVNITHNLTIPDADPGAYKLKVRYRKKGLKTWKELTDDIVVRGDSGQQVIRAKPEGVIKSFYTRARKYNEHINLYASLREPEGKTALLESSLEQQEFNLTASNSSLKLEAMAGPGKNVYALLIRDAEKDEILDRHVLVVELNRTGGAGQAGQPESGRIGAPSSQGDGAPAITGGATSARDTFLYLSNDELARKLAPVALVVAVGIASIVTIRRHYI